MTGFGAASLPLIITGKTMAMVNVECRSVNGRFLDLTIRSPEEARGSESAMRELIGKKINRGKVEFRVHIHRDSAQNSTHAIGTLEASDLSQLATRINQQVLTELGALARLAQAAIPDAKPLTTADILRWPGVMIEESIGAQELNDAILQAATQALEALSASRQTEGAALTKMILQRVDAMEQIVHRIEPIIPQASKIYQEKLAEKLTTILAGIDQQGRSISKDEVADRIRQEVVLYGVKIDVAEEISRLSTHFQAVRTALSKGGPVGKRLDFLMQELQRESNTLGSKSVTQETSDASMELKLLVEQIREQVQNLE
jgi:uncharacterized protein (TIGR00255 family)